MHWFSVGWDDREYALTLATRILSPRVKVDLVPRSPREILGLMATADLNLCMRFHSIVFAHRIGAPFIPFDYTAGGKIHAYLTEYGLEKRALRFPEMAAIDEKLLESSLCGPSL